RRHTRSKRDWSSDVCSSDLSDNMYLYENLEKHAPIAQTFDPDSNLKAQDRMRQLASRPDLIVPGHDPAVFAKFPQPGKGVARIRSEERRVGKGCRCGWARE